MHAYTLTVGDRPFRLHSSCNLSELSDALTDAVRAGGGMVALPMPGSASVTVLVSPGLGVVLEAHEVDPAPFTDRDDAGPWLAADDLDY